MWGERPPPNGKQPVVSRPGQGRLFGFQGAVSPGPAQLACRKAVGVSCRWARKVRVK